MTTDPLPSFEEHRPLLFGIAYRMLGTVMDTLSRSLFHGGQTFVMVAAAPPLFRKGEKAGHRVCLAPIKSYSLNQSES